MRLVSMIGVLFFSIGLFSNHSNALESNDIYIYGDWRIKHEFFQGSSFQACSASIANANGDSLDFTAWEDESLTLFFFISNEFRAANGSKVFLIIDDDMFVLDDAEITRNSVTFDFDSGAQLARVLLGIQSGSVFALSILNPEQELASWPLKGSDRVLPRLFECQRMIERFSLPSQIGVRG